MPSHTITDTGTTLLLIHAVDTEQYDGLISAPVIHVGKKTKLRFCSHMGNSQELVMVLFQNQHATLNLWQIFQYVATVQVPGAY